MKDVVDYMHGPWDHRPPRRRVTSDEIYTKAAMSAATVHGPFCFRSPLASRQPRRAPSHCLAHGSANYCDTIQSTRSYTSHSPPPHTPHTMTEGLTRRRGPGAAAGGSASGGPSASNSSADLAARAAPSGASGARSGGSTGIGRTGAPVSAAGGAGGSGAMEGRGKVAYDPRDFDNGNEEKEVPRLTLMEEVLLLGLKDKAVSM